MAAMMKPVSHVNRENIIKEMYDVVDSNGYETSYDVQASIYDAWEKAKTKSGILPLLRKHPNWDEKRKMIWFTSDFTREIEYDQLLDFTAFLYDIVGNDTNVQSICYFIENYIKNQFFDESMTHEINVINKLNDNYKLRTNMKASKAILKICREEGWDKLGGTYIDRNGNKKMIFDREYAKLADALNPIRVKRHTIISLNPVDFYYMSNGKGWTSCHSIIDKGCYSSGTVSYMLDEGSFIFYTLSEEYDGISPELQEKINRQVFSYKYGTFMQSRLYPQANDHGADHAYKETREIVQKVLADCSKTENLWNAPERNITVINKYVKKGNDATCYPDWQPGCPGSSNIILSAPKGSPIVEMTVGAQPICVTCGRPHSITQSISCEGQYSCSVCGDFLSEDDAFWCEDVEECRCSDHMFYCEECDNCYAIENLTRVNVNRYGGKTYDNLCPECANRTAFMCMDCGEMWGIEYNYNIDGLDYCPECADDYDALFCEECGNAHTIDNLIEYNDYLFCCQDCIERYKKRKEKE